jgi:signal transduction histidine kinase
VVARDDTAAMHMYRIAQEAITNAVKHGNADEVLVELTDDAPGGVRILRIRDDGRGFPEKPEPSSGVGLRIMRHRAGMLGGDLDVRAGDDGGVVVECVIPLEQ